VVVKARRLEISQGMDPKTERGAIRDFFQLMGDLDYLASEVGVVDQYILCWFDDEADFNKSWS